MQYRTDSLVVRVMWILAVVACASCLIFQLRQVLVQFLSYEFSTVTKEDVAHSAVSQFACYIVCYNN